MFSIRLLIIHLWLNYWSNAKEMAKMSFYKMKQNFIIFRMFWLVIFCNTRNFSCLRRVSFLLMCNMSPYFCKTIFILYTTYVSSFIKNLIGGAVFEKNHYTIQTFVVLFIGWACVLTKLLALGFTMSSFQYCILHSNKFIPFTIAFFLS